MRPGSGGIEDQRQVEVVERDSMQFLGRMMVATSFVIARTLAHRPLSLEQVAGNIDGMARLGEATSAGEGEARLEAGLERAWIDLQTGFERGQALLDPPHAQFGPRHTQHRSERFLAFGDGILVARPCPLPVAEGEVVVAPLRMRRRRQWIFGAGRRWGLPGSHPRRDEVLQRPSPERRRRRRLGRELLFQDSRDDLEVAGELRALGRVAGRVGEVEAGRRIDRDDLVAEGERPGSDERVLAAPAGQPLVAPARIQVVGPFDAEEGADHHGAEVVRRPVRHPHGPSLAEGLEVLGVTAYVAGPPREREPEVMAEIGDHS